MTGMAKYMNKHATACAMVASVMSFLAGAAAQAQSTTDAQPKAAPTFDLNELRVLHNSLLTPLVISNLLYPHLGKNKTLDDVEAARVALETEYHVQGYGTVYVSIPEQTVGADGVVRLDVTEAVLQRPHISGARYFSNSQIRAAVPEAREGAVPNLTQLQAQVSALNAVTSDRSITPVLRAGSEPGTVALDMKVTDTLPLHAAIEVNNQYTADTKPLRALASLRWDNAWGRQDSLSLNYQTAPQETSQVRVAAAAYLLRLPNDNKLSFTYIDSTSNVATVGDITVAGKGKTWGVSLLHGLETSARVVSSVQIGFTYKDSLQNVLLGPEQGLSTPLKYTVLQAGHNLMYQQDTRIWMWNNSLALGVSGLGDSREEFDNKCYGCKPGFLVWRSDASVTQKLPANWQASWSLSGQYTPDPTVSNEQWLIGGAHSVRGYLESEELGDIGLRSALEVRAPNVIPEKWLIQISPYVFQDWARARFQNPLPSQPAAITLASIGAGIDLVVGSHISGTLLYGRALKEAAHTRKGDGRYQFAVRGVW